MLFDSEKHINLRPQERHVGYLFQNYALFPNMTLRKNILCGMTEVYGRDEKERRLQEAMLEIRRKFGKNAILKGTSLQEGATMRDRNQSIGGHKA